MSVHTSIHYSFIYKYFFKHLVCSKCGDIAVKQTGRVPDLMKFIS